MEDAAGASHACSHPCRGATVPLPEIDARRWPTGRVLVARWQKAPSYRATKTRVSPGGRPPDPRCPRTAARWKTAIVPPCCGKPCGLHLGCRTFVKGCGESLLRLSHVGD